MFNKKDNTDTRTVEDRELAALRDHLSEIGAQMDEDIKDILIKQKTLSLYIPGDRFTQANEELNAARMRLDAHMDDYDKQILLIVDYKRIHREQLTHPSTPYWTSQEWVECTVESILKLDE